MTPTNVIGKIAAFEMSQKWVDKRSQLLEDHMLLHVMKRTMERRLSLQAPQVKRKNKKVMMMKIININIILQGRRNNLTSRKGNGDDPED
jgi:hypothetical protein